MIVFRWLDIAMVVVLLGVVGWTFKVKHDSHLTLDRVAELERRIAAEKAEIELLKSDWSLLTSPTRLQELVERYGDQLELQPMQPEQLIGEENLPQYKRPLQENVSPMFDGFVEADKSIKTGSVNKQSGQASQ